MVGNGHAGCPALPPGRFQASNNIITMGKAKRGGVFGMIRGSVGPATYSIGKDGAGKKQQIIREKPIEVANPRTRAQAIQRMKMVPVQYALGLLGDIVDHSFRGIQEGWPSRRHFMSLAMRELDIPFIKKGSLDRAIGGYQISAGTLGDTRAYNKNSQNNNSRVYEYPVPTVDVITLPAANFLTNKYGAWCREFIRLNPQFADGDELAVLYFMTDNTSHKAISVLKRRILLDVNFTEDTPAEFIYTYGEEGSEMTWDGNAVYAFSLYNDFVTPELVQQFFDNAAISLPTDRLATWIVPSFLGLQASNSAVDNVYPAGVALIGDRAINFVSDSTGESFVPQTATDANRSGFIAAAALIQSRREGDSWNYSVSDICLTYGYLQVVNTAALMEAAIASYMTETGLDTSSSEYYLQLTQEQADVYGIASVNVSGTITVSGAETNVIATLAGRINPVSGKNILFVNADGYIISDGSGADVALAYGGFRWKNANTGAYITPSNYVKAADIADTSNIEFANLVD